MSTEYWNEVTLVSDTRRGGVISFGKPPGSWIGDQKLPIFGLQGKPGDRVRVYVRLSASGKSLIAERQEPVEPPNHRPHRRRR